MRALITQNESAGGWPEHRSSRSRYPGDWDPWIIWVALIGGVVPELVQLETRVGTPGENVLRVAEETGVDLIALGWSHDLGPGHAAVVCAALERSRVPLLVIPRDRRWARRSACRETSEH